jgi:hypothetical protein
MEALFVTKTGDRSGSKEGKEWRVSNFLIETKGKYPKKVLLEAWGDVAAVAETLNEGDEVEVLFEPEAREYNGKWYNTIKCFKLELLKAEDVAAPKKAVKAAKTIVLEEEENGELPF